jgi:hypothetical protein
MSHLRFDLLVALGKKREFQLEPIPFRILVEPCQERVVTELLEDQTGPCIFSQPGCQGSFSGSNVAFNY